MILEIERIDVALVDHQRRTEDDLTPPHVERAEPPGLDRPRVCRQRPGGHSGRTPPGEDLLEALVGEPRVGRGPADEGEELALGPNSVCAQKGDRTPSKLD